MKSREFIIWELILVLASVLVFRSLWMLMDRVELLNDSTMLVLMLFMGVALSIPALYKLTHKD
ncbi:MAG: hypothetical protein QCI38_06440 [Candidatus Thermoplasmatota archaeon]|nr:hypothetical protein [Candidatus Thermoplasmatota archaeon]